MRWGPDPGRELGLHPGGDKGLTQSHTFPRLSPILATLAWLSGQSLTSKTPALSQNTGCTNFRVALETTSSLATGSLGWFSLITQVTMKTSADLSLGVQGHKMKICSHQIPGPKFWPAQSSAQHRLHLPELQVSCLLRSQHDPFFSPQSSGTQLPPSAWLVHVSSPMCRNPDLPQPALPGSLSQWEASAQPVCVQRTSEFS